MRSQTFNCSICELVGVENFSSFQFESCDVLICCCVMFSFYVAENVFYVTLHVYYS